MFLIKVGNNDPQEIASHLLRGGLELDKYTEHSAFKDTKYFEVDNNVFSLLPKKPLFSGSILDPVLTISGPSRKVLIGLDSKIDYLVNNSEGKIFIYENMNLGIHTDSNFECIAMRMPHKVEALCCGLVVIFR
tara:strand:+ start:51 stop:449 length:399 start_codon:yes stop_codon:yes gene_type:complete